MVDTLKQPDAVMVFQLLDGAGDCGLGHMKQGGSPGYVALLINSYKNAKMFNCHWNLHSDVYYIKNDMETIK